MGIISSLFNRGRKAGLHSGLLQAGKDSELLREARSLLASDQETAALSLIQAGARAFPNNTEISQLAREVETDLAKRTIHAATERLDSDHSVSLRAEISDLYRSIGDPVQAISFGRLAIQVDPKAAGGYRAVGRVYFEGFKTSQNSIDGMNALRYVSKAHSLAPSSSLCILQLAEIFAILRAPVAARRFLEPVQRAFGEDPMVRSLVERIEGLPEEGTSHIQDLFLRHERLLRGESPAPPEQQDLDATEAQKMVENAKQTPGVEAFYVVSGSREILANHGPDSAMSDDLADLLGMVSDTAVNSSDRMGIGQFTELVVTYPKRMLVIQPLPNKATAIFVGDSSARPEVVGALFDRMSRPQEQEAAQ